VTTAEERRGELVVVERARVPGVPEAFERSGFGSGLLQIRQFWRNRPWRQNSGTRGGG
jgi:hypothetical protein